MSEFTEEFLQGWHAAREIWQRTGSVMPYPPGFYESETVEAAVETEVSEEAAVIGAQ